MITVTEYPVSLRWELKRLLEVFIKGGSLTATLDRLIGEEAEAIAILQVEGYCILDLKPIEDLKARDQARVNDNEEAVAHDAILIEQNDKAHARDRLLIQENYRARERDEQQTKKKDHTFEAEGKTDFEINLLLEGLDNSALERSFRAKTDQQLAALLEINSVDGGDINGRFRFVAERLEDAGRLIAEIIRSVRPKTK